MTIHDYSWLHGFFLKLLNGRFRHRDSWRFIRFMNECWWNAGLGRVQVLVLSTRTRVHFLEYSYSYSYSCLKKYVYSYSYSWPKYSCIHEYFMSTLIFFYLWPIKLILPLSCYLTIKAIYNMIGQLKFTLN